ncbi:MAG: type II toxin-antitoxin system RelE/ParE family toxin [Prevotellaceae bacterium]|jgi:plasmid stabilization system protein ParE|nr:type II toxin-antitoxin system RelE/ParE family toxin [Prevotellaceae bacterium]
MNYTIRYSDEVLDDFRDISLLITNEFGMPQTAFKYLRGLKEKINSLEKYPTMYAIQTDKYIVQNFGWNMRRLNYKKVSVIYTIIDNEVWIIRAVWAYSIR